VYHKLHGVTSQKTVVVVMAALRNLGLKMVVCSFGVLERKF